MICFGYLPYKRGLMSALDDEEHAIHGNKNRVCISRLIREICSRKKSSVKELTGKRK